MAITGQCFNCGAETNDWDYLGNQKVDVCGDAACHRELRDSNRAIDDQARLDAVDDNYDRYR